MQIPARTYGACPSLRMTTPDDGDGTGAPGGAGTSRVRRRLAMCSDGASTENYRKPTPKPVLFCTKRRFPPPRAVVRSRPVLGQAHTPRRRLLPFAALALAVLAAPAVGGANPSQSASTLRAQDAAIAAKSRAAVLGLYSLDQRLGGRAHEARRAPAAGAARCAPSARASRISCTSRSAARRSRSASSRSACACSTSRATSSRSRSCSARRASTRR